MLANTICRATRLSPAPSWAGHSATRRAPALLAALAVCFLTCGGPLLAAEATAVSTTAAQATTNVAASSAPTTTATPAAAAGTNEQCLACHEGGGLELNYADGRKQSVDVDSSKLKRSAHAELSCVDCHPGYPGEGHETPKFINRREQLRARMEVCLNCHSIEGTMHSRLKESQSQLICRDCHGGGHEVQPSLVQGCLGCHTRPMSLTLSDGELVSLQMKTPIIVGSVHKNLGCNACHRNFTVKDHPDKPYENHHQLSWSMADACKSCHPEMYARSLEGIHHRLNSKNDRRAPNCADCHGSHAISDAATERLKIAERCRKCHASVYDVYASSVHGNALKSGSRDVLGCVDCHQAHGSRDPLANTFRTWVPQLCGDCHGNQALMKRYGMTGKLMDSYLQDFHGVTAAYYKKEDKDNSRIAVCTDCHGIHDIATTRGREADEVKSKLLERCRSCHPDAKTNFPDAWLSHYPPTLAGAPLVFLVDLAYKLMIPFMVIGLMLQILLHLYRYTVKR
jgi:predicted CXXCH cytochrome family protein